MALKTFTLPLGSSSGFPFTDLFQGGMSEINTYENHIFFYTEVTPQSILQFNLDLMKLTKNILGEAASRNKEPEEIVIHISSPGGDVFSGINAYDHISQASKLVPVHMVVEGDASSAASLMLMGASKRVISPNSFVLIHELRSWVGGQLSKITEEHDNLVRIQNRLTKIYTKHTKFTEEELKNYLRHDIYMDAETCLEKGIVDEIGTILI